MHRILQLLLIALMAAGWVALQQPPIPERHAPAAVDTQAPSTPAHEEEIYPAVPRHPAATTDRCVSENRCFLEITEESADEVLDWYSSELEDRGWNREPTLLPSTMAQLFSRDGEYLSISGRHFEPSTVVWFHLRRTPEVTLEEAVKITSATHMTQGETKWIPCFVPDFESERYGSGVKHPVWVVEARFPRSSVTVWVDAITAEPFRIRQTDDF